MPNLHSIEWAELFLPLKMVDVCLPSFNNTQVLYEWLYVPLLQWWSAEKSVICSGHVAGASPAHPGRAHCGCGSPPQSKVSLTCCYCCSQITVSSPGHSQILSRSCGENSFLHGYKIKSRSGLGTRLPFQLQRLLYSRIHISS